MDEQHVRGSGPHGRAVPGGPPPWWRHRMPPGGAGPTDDEASGSRWPWRSTLLVTVFVLVGSTFASHGQEGDRTQLDVFARVLLLVVSGLLLWRQRQRQRQRHPVPVVFGTAAAAMVYIGAGYPYGPVFSPSPWPASAPW